LIGDILSAVELRHLRYFVAVGEALHFGRAAARLRIAQPSLSHQIRQLETELQTPLLRRTKRRVNLTEAGRLFLDEARDILARVDHATVIARRGDGGEARRLRVGVGYCMDVPRITTVVSAFNARHEAVHVELHTLPVPVQSADLRGERLDLGFVRPPASDPALSSEVLAGEPLVVALPARHRLAVKDSLRLSMLASESFVLPPRVTVPIFHDVVVRACRSAGFVPHAPHEADHLEILLGLVAAGRRWRGGATMRRRF
jgi:DNA-binding transcriptional LysR family regulator